MKKFRVTIINNKGKKVNRYVDANDSKEAIDTVCDLWNVGYADVVGFKELEG